MLTPFQGMLRTLYNKLEMCKTKTKLVAYFMVTTYYSMVPSFETFIPLTSAVFINLLPLLWQVLSLGLFRSDYLLHGAASNTIKQVEINTIASGFGGIGTYLPSLHG
jgi:hypothetical protein